MQHFDTSFQNHWISPLKASKTTSKFYEISIVLAGVEDDFDIPDWDWCP